MQNKAAPDRLIRITGIIGCKKRGIEPIVPISKTAWYEGIKEGIYPEPIKLSGGRTSAWRESDLLEVVNGTYKRSQVGDAAA